MTTKEKIKKELVEAMKSGDSQKRDTLRMLDSMIKNEEILKNKKEEGLTEEEILAIIKRAVRQREDSVNQYKKGGRVELAEKEQIEIDILKKYLPEEMSEKELRDIVKGVLEKVVDIDFGKIMGIVMSKIKGRADGNMVRKVVEEEIKKK